MPPPNYSCKVKRSPGSGLFSVRRRKVAYNIGVMERAKTNCPGKTFATGVGESAAGGGRAIFVRHFVHSVSFHRRNNSDDSGNEYARWIPADAFRFARTAVCCVGLDFRRGGNRDRGEFFRRVA